MSDRTWIATTSDANCAKLVYVDRYVLGSEHQLAVFGEHVEYRPDGVAHAVDLQAPMNMRGSQFAYAVCGQPVHVWPELPFDANRPGMTQHDACLAVTHPGAHHEV